MLRWTLPCLLLLALAGCDKYDIKVNDRVVFTPRPLFSDYSIADAALAACVEQAIIDGNITIAADLRTLNCSHAGIADLDGIAIFSGLTQLKLSSNEIRNLVELGQLLLLQVLYLDDNQVVDPVPLFDLPALNTLDLSGNAQMQCPTASAFVKLEELTLPEHCRRS